jgi:hypothetical protein
MGESWDIRGTANGVKDKEVIVLAGGVRSPAAKGGGL